MSAALLVVAAVAVYARPDQRTSGRTTTAAAEMTCPAQLGTGVRTARVFCDVLAGADPAAGIIVKIPPHVGEARLSFDLHNRHTYSEQLVREHRAFTIYTATVGVLTMSNDLLARAVVRSEFRTEDDLLDRIRVGGDQQEVKAVAPLGSEPIVVTIPDKVTEVSILGEKLETVRGDGRNMYRASGRPIAAISNVQVTYRPAPVRRRR